MTEKYQYRIGIEYSYLHSISIASVSEKVVSKTSAKLTYYVESHEVVLCLRLEEVDPASVEALSLFPGDIL